MRGKAADLIRASLCEIGPLPYPTWPDMYGFGEAENRALVNSVWFSILKSCKAERAQQRWGIGVRRFRKAKRVLGGPQYPTRCR